MMARTKYRPEGFYQAPGPIYTNLRDVGAHEKPSRRFLPQNTDWRKNLRDVGWDVYLMIGIYVN